ncbi:MAG TPA: PVC-type heme-binding CxxCH protein [Pirellulales bacterium]|nr:PVC-type heme-binding CxxCH protein [Pirellulales bacterium]
MLRIAKRLRLPVALLYVLFGASAPRAIALEASNEQIELNGHTFTLPSGFTIEVAAAAPLVERPITADFDERGRLYVSDSSGSNDKVQKQLEEKPHRVVRLEDTDGDGRFDRSTVFADKLMFPEGTMWYDGSLYVAAPPSIWKLTDTDGDGVADKREEWFQGKTLTGCANDLHGPYLGPDGWIYWCKGAFAEQTYERPGRPPLVTKASHIFRARPDGTQIEPVMTGGMDNPVDVVFTPGGERIFTTTFLVHPGGGLRDGLIHAVYGGVYGKVHAVLDGHPRTSPDVMPVLAHLGPAAPCGLTRYESDVFGKDYQDNLFACLFNMQKVTRHVLSEDGASFASRDEDFVVSNNRDFHPTDVLEDADGSLLIVDTGGWYKLCCPTSQLVKPDVLGAIYRVRRKDADRIADPRGSKLEWKKANLIELLDDARPAVRHRAIQGLGAAGEDSVPVLKTVLLGRNRIFEKRPRATPGPARKNVNAIWALLRIGTPSAREALRLALDDPNPIARQAAIHSVSVLRDRDALSKLIALLSSESLPNRRAAAEAIGRFGSWRGVEPLMVAIGKMSPSRESSSDRVLEHSLIYALIEIGNAKSTAGGLTSNNAVVQRAALIALDQMPNGGLTAETVMPLLAANDSDLRRTAAWVAGHHPDWADALAGYLRQRLADERLSNEDRAELATQLGTFAQSPTIQELLSARMVDGNVTLAERRTVLEAMQRSGLKDVPAPWISALAQLVGVADKKVDPDLLAAIRAVPIARAAAGPVRAALKEFASREGIEDQDRLAALAAVPGGLDAVPTAMFELLTAQLDIDAVAGNRAAAVEVFSKAKLTSDQLTVLAPNFAAVGPLEIDRLLSAFEQSTDAQVGRALLASLGEPAVIPSLRVEMIKPRLAKYPPAVHAEAEKLYARLTADMAAQRARLDELAESLPRGDVRRGQAIFNNTKTACATCHAIGYLGGRIGPDLTRIGQVRAARDLLESIVYPSASFVRSFEPVAVVTVDGLTYNGLVRKDAPDELVLVKSPTEEIRIPRNTIEEIRPGTVSIMPQGLDKQLTPQELADLVVFLQGCK